MRKTSLVALLVVGALLVPLAVFASHQFNDVPDSHIFHTGISWMKDNNITVGCNPPANTNFCPEDNVTRGQMATFMKRLAENNVVDAATLDGLDSSAFASAADNGVFFIALDDFVTLSAATVTVITLDLPAGSYAVTAEGLANNNDAAKVQVNCTLAVGTAFDDFFGGDGLSVGPQATVDREAFTLSTAGTLDAAGSAVLACSSSATSSNIISPSITAIRASSPLNIQSSTGTASDGDPEG